MKRSILFSVAVLAASTSIAQQQVSNSDFEQWETTTDETNEPVNWNSFQTASGTWASFGGNQMDRSTDVRPGSTGMYSAKIEANSVLGTVANGNITLGKINMGSTTPTDAANYNYSVTSDANFSEAFTDAPDSIYFWAKFSAGNIGHSARVSAVIHNNTNNYKDPNDVSGSNTVATAIYNFPYSGGNWELIKVPFTYVGNPADAAFIIVTFTTNMTPGVGTDGDILLIDDMELIYFSDANVSELSQSNIHVSLEGDQLNIFSKEELSGDYLIYNSQGALMQSGEIISGIPFEGNSGMYFIHLNTSKGSIVKKFIKN